MGLIDFVKSAGQKIGLFDEEEAESRPPQPARTPDELRALQERRLAAGIVRAIEGHGFEVEDLGVRVDGDLARVQGTVVNQEVREKVVLLAGNTAGIARVDDQLAVEASAPASTLYTVQSGDSLSKIARQHYRDGNQYQVIFEANRPMLEHPDRIYPGQVLRIPPKPGAA